MDVLFMYLVLFKAFHELSIIYVEPGVGALQVN